MTTIADSEPFKAFENLQSALKKGDQDDISNYQDLINQAVENILSSQVSNLDD